MMCDLPRFFLRALAFATFLGSIVCVGLTPMVSWAQGAVPEVSGTAAQAPSTGTQFSALPVVSTPESGASPPASDPMAQRMNNYLHDRLRISPAQEPLWASLTQVMRNNATALAPLFREQLQARLGGNSIEMLSTGEKLDAVQLDGLRKFIAAYQALYASMSDEQKKIADFVFRRSQFADEPVVSSPVSPDYPSASPPPDYATIPAYPDYPPVYYFPGYSPLFNVAYIGVTAGPRFPFRGQPGFQNLGFQHPGFQRPGFQHPGFQHPNIHGLPPPVHVSGGLVRTGAPASHR